MTALALGGCRPQSHPGAPMRLVDVTTASGIDFVHDDGGSGRRYIVEPMSAGLATFDYDLDGLIDVHLPNGAALPGSVRSDPVRDGFFRNIGDMRFESRGASSGLDDTGFGLGVVVGDYNEDGFPDVFLNNLGPNVLLLNNGDGTFTDITADAGLSGDTLVGAGACFLDADNDGDLDLYVGNYLEFDPSRIIDRSVNGIPTYPSPYDFRGVPDAFHRNDGDGTFTDASGDSGIAQKSARAMGCIAVDTDADGDTDILVADDGDPNLHWINDGSGAFEEQGLATGLAYDGFGDENAGMGVDCADCDADGLIDVLVTTYRGQSPVFYRNLGGGLFEDATAVVGLGSGTFSQVKWGCGLVDFDDDGWCDVFIANGHTDDTAEQIDPGACYRCRPSVLRNVGGRFTNVTDQAGPGLVDRHCSRGAAFDDLDNDGDVDVVVLNSRDAPTVLRNDRRPGAHWIDVELRGTTANRDAVGATVRVTADGRTSVRQVHAGRGYQGHFGSRLHFGLGEADRVDQIEVEWPGGGRSVVSGSPTDRRLFVRQDGWVGVFTPRGTKRASP